MMGNARRKAVVVLRIFSNGKTARYHECFRPARMAGNREAPPGDHVVELSWELYWTVRQEADAQDI